MKEIKNKNHSSYYYMGQQKLELITYRIKIDLAIEFQSSNIIICIQIRKINTFFRNMYIV